MKRIIWSGPARRDLDQVALYYEPIDPDYADRLTTTAVEAGRWLAGHPSAGTLIAASDIRKWRVARTPYVLLYRASPETLRVLRLIHTAQDWKRFL